MPSSVPCACTTVKKLSRVLVRKYDEALAGAGMNVTQLAVMRAIDRHGGVPLARVAGELEMDRTSLYRAIAPMLRDGWLILEDGRDARSRAAKITRRGKWVLAGAGRGWDLMQERLIHRFGGKEWQSLAAQLQRLTTCTEEIETV